MGPFRPQTPALISESSAPRPFLKGPPRPRVTFVRTKVTKMRWGDPSPSSFCPIGHYEIDIGQPLNFHLSLVIGAVIYGLRLSALGMIGTSCRVK